MVREEYTVGVATMTIVTGWESKYSFKVGDEETFVGRYEDVFLIGGKAYISGYYGDFEGYEAQEGWFEVPPHIALKHIAVGVDNPSNRVPADEEQVEGERWQLTF